jgi:hypothetical protein
VKANSWRAIDIGTGSPDVSSDPGNEMNGAVIVFEFPDCMKIVFQTSKLAE